VNPKVFGLTKNQNYGDTVGRINIVEIEKKNFNEDTYILMMAKVFNINKVTCSF